ncbi:OmpP1/FadL family transporter [Dokdonia sp. Hel_I_53]|uniref:OmpP1/FadL family transporter n=1 Tax=Dokdonia sp. Hel_I_53 TaxID=1566287 RepID=UPI00119ADBA8|nr:outer membrane protein transport protein [Dokdonia sp. Hel_I_53]TVZ52350.1 long-chain fatty acid transport protein [Dokdonia sp. Hel_I_53]
MKKVLSAFVLLLVGTMVYAGGYRVSLQGQRGLAMGHTGVAMINNAELAFFNPGGLIHLENKLNIAAGGFGVFSDVKFQNPEYGQSVQTDSPTGTPLYLYASYKLNERVAVGLAVYTPYGSTVEYPTDWAGSHLVNSIELSAIFIQPLASFKLLDDLSIGGGPILAIGGVNFNRNLSRSTVDIDGNRSNVEIDAQGVNAFGFSVGAMITPSDMWSFGLNYRSKIDVKVEAGDGDAVFTNVPNSPLSPIQNGTYDFTATLPLPAEWTVGASFKPTEKWTLNFDYNYAEWEAYDSLDLDFLNSDGSVALESRNARNYKNASTFRLGAQYEVSSKFALRAGTYFDESPVRDGYFAPETPRNDSFGFTGGLTFNVTDKLAIDASFLYLRFKEVDASYDYYEENGVITPFEGTYKSSAFSPGIGVSYKL